MLTLVFLFFLLVLGYKKIMILSYVVYDHFYSYLLEALFLGITIL